MATDLYTLERYPFFASPGVTSEDVTHLLTLARQLIEQVEKIALLGEIVDECLPNHTDSQ